MYMLRVKILPARSEKAQQYRSAPRRACQCTDELSATPNGGGAAKGFTLWNSNQCSICDRHGLQTLSKISFYRVKTNLSSVTCHDPKLTKPLILLTLWLSQYRKSDSTFSSSESVAARSDCRKRSTFAQTWGGVSTALRQCCGMSAAACLGVSAAGWHLRHECCSA